jgi:hypothetical protein
MDATTCRAFYHMLYLGEVYRLARMTGEEPLAGELQARLAAPPPRSSGGDLRVLPLRLLAVQAGAVLSRSQGLMPCTRPGSRASDDDMST